MTEVILISTTYVEDTESPSGDYMLFTYNCKCGCGCNYQNNNYLSHAGSICIKPECVLCSDCGLTILNIGGHQCDACKHYFCKSHLFSYSPPWYIRLYDLGSKDYRKCNNCIAHINENKSK